VSLAWTASTDAVGVSGYRVYRNGTQVGTTSSTAFTDGGLTPSTTYSYTVAAYDGSGNVSAASAPVSATTTAGTPATPTFVQVASAVPQTAQSVVATTYSKAQVAGDTNVLVIGWNDVLASITSVTDSAGNVYQVAAPTVRGNGLSQAIYYAPKIAAAAAGANVVSVVFDRAAQSVDVRILEYGGLDQTSPLDVSAGATGTSATASSGSVTTHYAKELLVGGGSTKGHFTGPGPGYTSRVITSPDGDIAEDQVVSSAGTYSATGPQTLVWVMQVAAFRAAGQ